jgi:hypothetical protein
MVSKKVTLNMLHVLLGLETVSVSTCRCILYVCVSFREPFSLFNNFHNTLLVLFAYFASACSLEPSVVRPDWIKLSKSSLGYVGFSAKEYQMR